MSEPVEHRCEADKAEKGDGEFLVARGDAPVALDAGEKILDSVAVPIKTSVEVELPSPAAAGWDADHAARAGHVTTEGVGIKAAISDGPLSAQMTLERRAGPQVVLLAGCKMEPNGAPNSIDDSGQLRIEPSLCAAHRLDGLAAPRIGAVAVNLDKGAIQAADLTVGRRAEFGEQSRPQSRCAPPSVSGVDRTPRAEPRREISPRHTGTEDIPHRGDHESVVFRGTPAFASAIRLPAPDVVRSIFLAAPTAARVTPNDL